jgi:Carboxypeptidase regulatory-like domain
VKCLTVTRSFVVVAVCVISFTATLQAQFRGSLRGTVTDPQGAAIPGAKATLLDTGTNHSQVSTSDANGIYQFNALAPAPYRLTVEAQGFNRKVLEQVQIIPDQPNALDVALEVGQVQQSVTVSGTTEALDTETANLSGTVSSNEIQHMPTLGRDVIKVAALAPGSFGDNSQAAGNDNYNLPGTQTSGGQSGGADGIFKTENGAQIIANGNQTENNGISIDGISTTSVVWGGSTVITPSEDSVDNVKIVSNAYDAENGRFSGAQIQITSKGGTNQFHGSLFFTAHQPGFNAYQPYNGFGETDLRDDNKFNQFGGSIGGPIWKNKIFAFFNYETVREPNSVITGNQWYETPAFDAMARPGSVAATYLTFPGNGVVARGINPQGNCAAAGLTEGVDCRTIPGKGINVGTPLTTPLGSQDLTWTSTSSPGVGSGLGTVADLANYITENPTTFTATQYNGRLDFDATAKDRITFAMYWVPLTRTDFNGGERAYDLFHHNQINDAFSAIWNRTISSSFLNEARVNAAGYRWNEISGNPQLPVGLPLDNIGQTGSITANSFGPSVGTIQNQWTYSFKDVATKIIGRHNIKFGGELTRLFYVQDCAACGVPSYDFFNIWDFLNDAPHTEGAGFNGFNPTTGIPTTERQDDREDIWGFFAQDDFKLRRNLTINAGLRWSYFGPLSSKEGNMFTTTPGAGADFLTGLTVHRGNSWNAQKDNFGPQIGFAWSPGRLNDKVVIRGGYGINYNQEELAVSSSIFLNPGLIVTPTFNMSTPTSPNPGIFYATASDLHSLNTYPPNRNAIVTFGPNGLPTTGTTNIELFPTTLPTMLVHHYSFDIENDLGHHLIATLGYQGSLSRNIFFHENPNAVAAFGLPLNPQIGGGDYWNVNGRANYNALLAELKHQFSRQFMADAQFTWAKSMDTSSGPYFEQDYPYNLNLDYGRSDFNVGKAFKLFGMWQPVFFHGSRSWIDKIVGGWSLSGIFNIHSGFPWSPVVSVANGSLYCGTCGYTSLFPSAYLGGAGSDTSNSAFKGPASANYPLGGTSYFATPTYTAYSGNSFGDALPQFPAVHRNSLNQPGYKDVDLTIAKDFGLPNNRVLGENARFELRMDAFNVFNNLNFNPNLEISNNIASSNFGTISGALTGRVVTVGARFSF